jgi:predicted metal-dependent hydrolase
VDGVKGRPPLRLYQSRFELQQEAQAQGREAFIRWYCDRLSSILDTQIAAVVSRLEVSPRSVQVRDLGYRWGSCRHKGDLYFHWRVAMLPRTMIEYVVVHELVHLIEANHNHAFWDRRERMVSDWCDRKRWLAQNGASYDL